MALTDIEFTELFNQQQPVTTDDFLSTFENVLSENTNKTDKERAFQKFEQNIIAQGEQAVKDDEEEIVNEMIDLNMVDAIDFMKIYGNNSKNTNERKLPAPEKRYEITTPIVISGKNENGEEVEYCSAEVVDLHKFVTYPKSLYQNYTVDDIADALSRRINEEREKILAEAKEIPLNYSTSTVADVTPVNEKDIDNAFSDQSKIHKLNKMYSEGKIPPEKMDEMIRQFASENREPEEYAYAQSEYSRNPETFFEDNTKTRFEYNKGTVNIGGSPLSYNDIIKIVPPQDAVYYFNMAKKYVNDNNKFESYDYIRNLITKMIVDDFPLETIHTIGVLSSNEVLINDTVFKADFKYTEEQLCDILPLDCVNEFICGCYAKFINWEWLFNKLGFLNKHSDGHIRTLVFESCDFLYNYIYADLGIYNKGGLSSLFKHISSLEKLCVCGEVYTRETIDSEKSAKGKHNLAKNKRAGRLLKGIKQNIFVGAVDNIFEANGTVLSEFWESRKDRGLLANFGGTIALGTGYFVTGTTHIASHLLQNFGGIIKDAFTGGMKPTTAEELNVQPDSV